MRIRDHSSYYVDILVINELIKYISNKKYVLHQKMGLTQSTSKSLKWDNDKVLEVMKDISKQGITKLSDYDKQFNDLETTVSQLIDCFCDLKSMDIKLLSTFETQFRDILSLDLDVLCAKAYNKACYETILKIVMSYIIKYIAGLKFTTSVEMKKITGRRLSVNFKTVKLDDLLGVELYDSGTESDDPSDLSDSNDNYLIIRAFIVKQVEQARQQLTDN